MKAGLLFEEILNLARAFGSAAGRGLLGLAIEPIEIPRVFSATPWLLDPVFYFTEQLCLITCAAYGLEWRRDCAPVPMGNSTLKPPALLRTD